MLAPDAAERDAPASLSAAGDEPVLPDALPVELHLSDDEKAAVRVMLSDLVAALQTNRVDGAAQIARLLRRLGAPDATPANIDKVMDFDQFFRVTRIASARPALSLVLGSRPHRACRGRPIRPSRRSFGSPRPPGDRRLHRLCPSAGAHLRPGQAAMSRLPACNGPYRLLARHEPIHSMESADFLPNASRDRRDARRDSGGPGGHGAVRAGSAQ